MLLWSISKQFLKKLIPCLAVVMVVMGCFGLAFKQEKKIQAENRKILEQMNEKYKDYKNGKEYVDDVLDQMSKSAKSVIMKCLKKDKFGNVIHYGSVDKEISEDRVPVRDMHTLNIRFWGNEQRVMEFILEKFDINDELVYRETNLFLLNEEMYNHKFDGNTTYGDYLNNLKSNILDAIDKYDDIVRNTDQNIKILEAYGIRDKKKSEENIDTFNDGDICNNEQIDINDTQIENKIIALKCLDTPIEK